MRKIDMKPRLAGIAMFRLEQIKKMISAKNYLFFASHFFSSSANFSRMSNPTSPATWSPSSLHPRHGHGRLSDLCHFSGNIQRRLGLNIDALGSQLCTQTHGEPTGKSSKQVTPCTPSGL